MKAILLLLFIGIAGCATTGPPETTTNSLDLNSEAGMGGLKKDEAADFIEFCVDLDSQDDRFHPTFDPKYLPRIDSSKWALVFDSRQAVANDVYRYAHERSHSTNDDGWAKLYREIISNAKGAASQAVREGLLSTPEWGADFIAKDPSLNGFGPWQNAWTMYRGVGKDNKDAYAVAIRGTVFSSKPNVAEDFVFHTVAAKNFLTDRVQFADDDNASLHSGFTHATFTLMLDERYGVLAQLAKHAVQPGTKLYIIGHSQGAAMATMAHAFLHYAMRNDDSGPVIFKLNGMHYLLKSYAFAQPKPGNYAFSADFGRYTQINDNAIVINNTIDPVPKVPITLQGIGDIEGDFKGGSAAVRTIQFLSSFGAYFRRTVAFVAEPFERESAKGYSYFYNYPTILDSKTHDWISANTASTWNFVPAGHVIFVYGPPVKTDDLFYQHHSTLYRELIATQL